MRSRIIPLSVAFAAFSILGACSVQPENISGTVDTQASALRNAAPVTELPPTQVGTTKIYRCADNSLAYVDFFSNNTASIGAQRGGSQTRLTATSAEGPYTGEGYTLSGNGDTVQLAQPGKPEQRCRTNPRG